MYTATLGGQQFTRGPVTKHPTITAARAWAESYGVQADWCEITDAKGRVVAMHRRHGNSADWHRAEI